MFERTPNFAGTGVPLAEVHQSAAKLVGLREIWMILRRRQLLILACMLLLLIPAAIYVFTAAKAYTAQTTILIEPRRQSVVSTESPLPAFGTEAAMIESQVQIIRSPPVARRVVRKLNLVDDREFGINRKRKLIVMRDAVASSIAGTLGDWAVPSFLVDADPDEIKRMTDEQKVMAVAAKLEQRLTVARVGPTHVITVAFSAESPENAARIANAFAEAYLTDAYETRFENTRRAATWLEERLDELRMKTQESERAVEVYRAQNNLISAGGRLVSEQQVTEINNQLVIARARVAETKARLETAQEIIARGSDPGAVTEALTNESINRLKIQYSDISRRIADLQTRYGTAHPAVRNAQAELADTQALIQDELRRVAQSLRNEYEVSLSREQSLARSMAEVEARAATNNAAQVRLRELERDANSDRTLYQTFLSRFKETSVQEGVPASEARVLAPAERPRQPSEPRTALILGLALMLGTFVGISLSFVTEFMDDTFATREHVEHALGLPLLARVPLVKRAVADMTRVVLDQPLSSYADAIRGLRMAVSFSGGTGPAKVVAVASALPAEGKTTTAVNLAEYAASLGLKTLLIDADLRRPALSRMYTPEAGRGLGHILLEEATFDEVKRVNERTNLTFIPHVQDSKIINTSELLSSRPMANLLAEARASFDLIVLDVSPLVPVIDARALFEHVDKIILIVEWKKTPRSVVQEAVKHIRPFSQKILGVVLNKIDVTKSHHHDTYGSRAYAKRYPHYYGHNS